MTDDALEQAWRDLVDSSLLADHDGERRALAELERLVKLPQPREPDENRIDWNAPTTLLAMEVLTLRAAVELATAHLKRRELDKALDVLLRSDAPARSGRLRWNNRRQA